MKTKENDLRSAQAKERRRPTLDSTSAASRAHADAQTRARGLGEPPPGTDRGRAASGAMLLAVAEHVNGDSAKAASAARGARQAVATAEATSAAPLVSTAKSTAPDKGHAKGQAKNQPKVAAEAQPAGHGGLLLRAAREQRGLSIADVAKKTRIADRWIIAIEEARLDELPAPVFAIGYIRSYARTVGLDPAEVVEHFRSHAPQRDNSFWGSLPDRSGATPRSLEQAAAKRKYILWTAAFLLLGLAALLAAWLRSRR